MADANGNGNGHKDSLGVQAYRWILLGGVALLGILSARVLSAVDKTADKVDTLQLQLTEARSTTESRINAHRERLDSLDRRFGEQVSRDQGQDTKIEGLQQRIWQMPTSTPPR